MATGDNVSKANIYSTLVPPDGANVSKANLYAVLIPGPPQMAVSKANLYAVLTPGGVRPVVQVCG